MDNNGDKANNQVPTNRSARPEDFTFAFEYSEGSVPAAFYYEYSIEVSSDGTGEIRYLPDHPQNHPDELVELFRVTTDEMDRLYKVMKLSGMLHQTFQPSRTGRLGGPRARLQVIAGGLVFDVRTYGDMGDAERVERLFDLIRACVPDKIWDKISKMKKA